MMTKWLFTKYGFFSPSTFGVQFIFRRFARPISYDVLVPNCSTRNKWKSLPATPAKLSRCGSATGDLSPSVDPIRLADEMSMI
jgi:hypothetical protein